MGRILAKEEVPNFLDQTADFDKRRDPRRDSDSCAAYCLLYVAFDFTSLAVGTFSRRLSQTPRLRSAPPLWNRAASHFNM